MSENKSSIGFGLGLLAGVVGGIIAGVLYAPESGDKARHKLKDTVCDFAEKHSPEVSDAKKKAFESLDLFCYKLERQFKKFNNMLRSEKMRTAKELEDTDYDFN